MTAPECFSDILEISCCTLTACNAVTSALPGAGAEGNEHANEGEKCLGSVERASWLAPTGPPLHHRNVFGSTDGEIKMGAYIAWNAAILNTLGCLVQQLSVRGHIDGAELVECVQTIAAALRKNQQPLIADVMHQIAMHLLKSDEPLPPRG
jgi:hypothetical protein